MLSHRESATKSFRCARVGYIGEGAFVVREHGISASPMTISLVTFLFGNKKVICNLYWKEKIDADATILPLPFSATCGKMSASHLQKEFCA